MAATLAVLAAAWRFWPSSRDDGVRFVERSGAELSLVEEHSRRLREVPIAAPAIEATGAGRSERRLQRSELPLEVAKVLLPIGEGDSRSNLYDPRAYFVYRGGFEHRSKFAHHPAGGWTMRTNSLGLKGARELGSTRPALRLLIVGDSHVDGFCAEEENFTRLLEGHLAPVFGSPVEALNAGHAGYSFYQYLGTLERLLHLEPDVFIPVIYTGNDFVECLTLRKYYDGTLKRELLDENRRFRDAASRWPVGVTAQFLRQVLHFRAEPPDEALALETGVLACVEMAELCRRHGVIFIPLLIPPYADVQPQHIDIDVAELAREFRLGARDLHASARLTRHWIGGLAAQGIEVLDPRPAFERAEHALYWPEDHHLAVAGHELLARWLAREVERRFDRD